MTDEWPEGWKKVVCSCGELIGGYDGNQPPTVLQIQHGCGQVTTLYPSGMPPFSGLLPRQAQHEPLMLVASRRSCQVCGVSMTYPHASWCPAQ